MTLLRFCAKIKSGEDALGNNSMVKNFGELSTIYKEGALKTQKFKTLKSEMSRFEFNLLDIVKHVDIETIKKPSKATQFFLNTLRLFQDEDNLKSDTVKRC